MPTNATQVTAYLARAHAAADASGSNALSPELQRDFRRRLAALALTYCGAYALSHGISTALRIADGHSYHTMLPDVVAIVAILSGILLFIVARRESLSARTLGSIAAVVPVLGGLGIMGGYWGWEQHFDIFQRHVWAALADPAVSYPEGFVERMVGARLRVVYLDGVTWVGVWLLAVPILLPTPPRRTLVTVLTTASLVPGVLGLSLAVHGVPASLTPWVPDILLDVSVPTFICAGISFFVSRTVYRVTRELSRAQQLGSYQLVERIGVGGMGEVWRARHQLLARPAAIKLIRPEMRAGAGALASREMLHRFEREAQATAALHSPHTVELYDFGIGPDGTFYYVMELLDGFDLKTLVERFGPLPPARVVHLLGQACHSLEDAHRAGLVHRDVKPSNIFACRRGLDHDFVKVLDFGLVKNIDDAHDTIDVSLADVARGTPAFMAPEAVTGNAPVGAASDLYALGCVAYWLLTGTLVFEGPTPLATLMKHVQEPPQPPSARLGADVPGGLERLVLQCLAKDPGARPASAAVLGAHLAGWAAAHGEWTPERARGWWEQHGDGAAHVSA